MIVTAGMITVMADINVVIIKEYITNDGTLSVPISSEDSLMD